jgi:IS5 family transposase|tara:strand:+ start:446 stop:1375 length:930 start_codon:yes stop_codon:yes gene_type:complete
VEQKTFSDLEFDHKKKKTRREIFLERMDGLIPWRRMEKKISRHYPKAGRGRRPYPLSVMLRVHCVQLFYNLSDPAMEDMLYEIESVRRFAGLQLAGPIPDETTILNFRHLLEKHGLGKKLFEEINRHLADQDLMLKEGTVIDASIVSAPSSTKNKKRERDPEMHQGSKGNAWFFGMKMHIGVDEKLGLVHSVATTAANVHDINAGGQLLHVKEKAVWADAGYQGIGKRVEHEDRKVRWHIAMKPGKRSQLDPDSKEAKASIRAKVEHPFFYVKRVFGYSKVRYRGLAKNAERLSLLLGFANLMIGARYA